MTHYICTGECHGESKNPGLCTAEDCNKKGEPLVPCDCEDWNHDKVLSVSLPDSDDLIELDDDDEEL